RLEVATVIPRGPRAQRYPRSLRVLRQSAINREAHRPGLLRKREHIIGIVIVGSASLNGAAIGVLGLAHKNRIFLTSRVRDLPAHQIGKGFHVARLTRERIVERWHESPDECCNQHGAGHHNSSEALSLPVLEDSK